MAYVVDTNIVSELVNTRYSQQVIDWFWEHADEVFLTSITVEELYYGALQLPKGKRQQTLLEAINAIVRDCGDRILAYDGFCGYLCAKLQARAKSMGRTSSIEDFMIAAICQSNNMTLATRNVNDFDYLGIRVENPFEYSLPMETP